MPLDPPDVADRYRAAVLGLAVGDALGFPLRGVPPASLLRLPALAEDFAPRPRGRFAKGQFTDDTQLALALLESVVADGKVEGRSVGAHLSWLWQEGVILQPPSTLTEAAERLLRGTPWMSAGAPLGVQDASALSRAVIIGLWDAEDVSRLTHDVGTACVVTHKDPLCAAAAAAVARAVALGIGGHALAPNVFCDELAIVASVHDAQLGEELRHLPRLLSWDFDRALTQLRRVGVPAAELQGAEGLPGHCVPVLLTALYAALRVPHDFRQALLRVLRTGGEADVAAALCGAILGAQLGTEAIPARLRKNVLYAEHLVSAADRLWNAKQTAHVAVARRAARRA